MTGTKHMKEDKKRVFELAMKIIVLDNLRNDYYEEYLALVKAGMSKHRVTMQMARLDEKRDELYEELMFLSGNRGGEILRWIQNGMNMGMK